MDKVHLYALRLHIYSSVGYRVVYSYIRSCYNLPLDKRNSAPHFLLLQIAARGVGAATTNGIMKKLLVATMLAMCCIACHSQECPYKFLGIPIEGTMDEFAKKLEEKGFKKNYYSPPKAERDIGCYNYYFTGKFFGEDCNVFLYSWDINSNIISFVIVLYDKKLYLYRELRNALAKQYSDTNKWRFDTTRDIGDLSDYQIRQVLSGGEKFELRIMDITVGRPYINLIISDNGTGICYVNSLRVGKIEGEKEAKKALDL